MMKSEKFHYLFKHDLYKILFIQKATTTLNYGSRKHLSLLRSRKIVVLLLLTIDSHFPVFSLDDVNCTNFLVKVPSFLRKL